MKLYGIKNCDTVKKARAWLEKENIPFVFHDFKTQSLDEKTFKQWVAKSELFTVINKRSSTWRQLPDEAKHAIEHNHEFSEVVKNLSLIKRPVLQQSNSCTFGFKPEIYADLFK